jgi:hypothetical protein
MTRQKLACIYIYQQLTDTRAGSLVFYLNSKQTVFDTLVWFETFKLFLTNYFVCAAVLLDKEKNKSWKRNRFWVHEILHKQRIKVEFAIWSRKLMYAERKFMNTSK